MKTIIVTQTKISKYIFSNDVTIDILDNYISYKDSNNLESLICDLNKYNAEVITEVNIPSDWKPDKYKYVDLKFELNPDYSEIKI